MPTHILAYEFYSAFGVTPGRTVHTTGLLLQRLRGIQCANATCKAACVTA